MSDPNSLDCSVVVPSYRGAHRLPRLLNSLVDQDYRGTWEVLVVLDGPDASSQEILATYLTRLPLRIIIRSENGGVAAAMQDGLDAARGRIIIRCDDDLDPETTFIATHMRHHLADRPIGVMGPTRDVFEETPYAKAYGRKANARALATAYDRAAGLRWIGWAANNSAPKALLESVGGFDTSMWYGEDSELGYRLHRAGLPMIVDPDLEVAHHGPANSTESRAARAFVSGASRAAFERRHPAESQASPETRLSTLPAILWRRAVGVLAARVRDRSSYARLGRWTDSVIRVTPETLGEKFVALLVEAAGIAGKNSGTTDMGSFKIQKDDEISRELKNASGIALAADPHNGISIVIPHYGNPIPTQTLVAALENQVGAPPLQIIVVDDFSPEPIASAGSAQIIYRERNGGYGSAINTGARAAIHEILLILNSDLGISNHFIRDLSRAARPFMPAVVSPAIVGEDGETQWPARHFPSVRQQFVAALSGLARFRSSRWWHEAVGHNTQTLSSQAVNTDWVVGAVLMLPTAEFRRVHGFDEGFFMNSEEIDLQRRLRVQGLPSILLGAVHAVHESGGSSDPSLRRSWVISSALRYATKWGNHPALHRAALASAAVINFLTNALRQAAGRDVDSWATLRVELGYARLPAGRTD